MAELHAQRPPVVATEDRADIAGNEVTADGSTLNLYLRVEGSDEQIPVTAGMLTAIMPGDIETSHPVFVVNLPCHHADELEPDRWVLRDDLRMLDYDQAVDAGLIDTSTEVVGGGAQ